MIKITQKITIEEREIPLLFSLGAMAEIVDQMGELSDFSQIFNGKKRVKNAIKLIVILGNAGLEAAGKPADLTDAWVGRALHPSKLNEAQIACMAAIADGMKVETKQAEDGPRDLTLEELEKKTTP